MDATCCVWNQTPGWKHVSLFELTIFVGHFGLSTVQDRVKIQFEQWNQKSSLKENVAVLTVGVRALVRSRADDIQIDVERSEADVVLG